MWCAWCAIGALGKSGATPSEKIIDDDESDFLRWSGKISRSYDEATHGCRSSCSRLILITSLNGGLPFWLPHPREDHGVVEEEAWVLVVSEPLYARA